LAVGKGLETINQKVYDNVFLDDNLPEHLKTEIIGVCSGLASELEVEIRFNDYASGRRLKGTFDEVLDDEESLGHIKLLASAANYMASKLSQWYCQRKTLNT
jgi:hypothetical protein